MNTETGEIGQYGDLVSRAMNPANVVPIEATNLSQRLQAELKRTGKAQLSGRHRCPCGSGKRFKSCCAKIPQHNAAGEGRP